MQDIWRSYFYKHPNVTCFFVKMTNIKYYDNNVFLKDDTIYVHGKESHVPGILDKTLKSFKFLLDENFNFDYILRTNLSSVWNFHKLYNILENNPTFILGGILGPNGQFISGAGMLLRKDICKFIVDNQNLINYKIIDDVAIGRLLFDAGFKFETLTRHETYKYNSDTDLLKAVEDFYHFRCKFNENRQKDICVMQKLVKMIYGI